MEDLCCIREDDESTLSERMSVFVSDRSVGALTGPRRMGRENLVAAVADVVRKTGKTVMVVPGERVEHPDVILFSHWKDIDESLVSGNPEADVLYGQDLCHQVPAVVRVVKSERFRCGPATGHKYLEAGFVPR